MGIQVDYILLILVSVADIAEKYIVKCISSSGSLMSHNGDRSAGQPYYVGENIWHKIFLKLIIFNPPKISLYFKHESFIFF